MQTKIDVRILLHKKFNGSLKYYYGKRIIMEVVFVDVLGDEYMAEIFLKEPFSEEIMHKAFQKTIDKSKLIPIEIRIDSIKNLPLVN